MKKITIFMMLVANLALYSQPISINTTQYSVPQLVQQILFGNNSNACFSGEITNITWSTGSDFGASNGIGYFSNTNPNFPIPSGVVLSTGNALNSAGPNTSTLSDGTWPGDNDLFNYIDGLGIDPGISNFNDATILEFDFTPYINTISFDFLFASEEYGTFQCSFSDAFAFFLTDITAGTPPQNIALLPNSNTPISVVTIRDNAYNVACSSMNPNFFGNFNGGSSSNTAATNYNGETVLLNANSSVIPLHTYHMKLVIADRNDASYNSAVFLAANSFNFGIAPLTGTGAYQGLNELIDLCPNEEITIQAGQSNVPNAVYSWTQDGIALPAITTSSLTVTQSGVYGVTLSGPNGCAISSDTMTIQYAAPFPVNNPIDLYNSEGVFDLTLNTTNILNGLNPDDYSIYYFTNVTDAQNFANVIANPETFQGTDGQIIYVGIENYFSNCIEIKSFVLNPPLPPSNDKCEEAIPLILGNSFDDFPVYASTFGATHDNFNQPSFCDGTYSARDVWYSVLVPTSGNVTIETNGTDGATDTVLEAFSSCNSNISIGCNNNIEGSNKLNNLYSKLVLTNLTPGQSIVVRAFGKAETTSTFSISAYDIALSNDDVNSSKFIYYPVPVIDFLTISGHSEIKSIELYNLMGQRILVQYNTSNSNDIVVNMASLQPSLYFVKVINDNNTETLRVIKK